MIKPYGPFAHHTFEAIRRAEQLQVQALQGINYQFKTEREKTITEMSFNDLIADLDSAATSEQRQLLNERYAAMLVPFVEQIMAEQGGQNG
jgi:protein-tyrosine-phosphatase